MPAAIGIAGAAVGGLLAGASATAILANIGLGLALGAISRAIAPKPKVDARGARLQAGLGEDQPASFILGTYATAGDLVWMASRTRPQDTMDVNQNKYLVQVYELSDWPQKLSRLFVNGEWKELPFENGVWYDVPGYGSNLQVKYYDGTQTTADAWLMQMFPPPYVRPWTADMIGRGVPYLVVQTRHSGSVNHHAPKLLAELRGIPLYDPRRDSGVGGFGPHRLDNPATWGGDGDDNPVVQIYNVLLGTIRDPVTDEFIWGGQDIGQADLPLSDWFAAMNECDLPVANADGTTRPQYRSGFEVLLGEDGHAPADVIEELLKACQGEIAEYCGYYTIRVGPPSIPVYSFTDADIAVTDPQDYEPFPGIDQSYNAVTAEYPEPADGWQQKAAPPLVRDDLVTLDGGRRNTAALQFPPVTDHRQVQQLMHSHLENQRRFARHVLSLPPEARALSPLDCVAWSSERNEYSAKLFDLPVVEDTAQGNASLVLREIDPSDWGWQSDYEKPVSSGWTGRPPYERLPTIGFYAFAHDVDDPTGNGRRPGILAGWDPDMEAEKVHVRVRPKHAEAEQVHAGNVDSGGDTDSIPSVLEIQPGVPVYYVPDQPVISGWSGDVARGSVIISHGILPATEYYVDLAYESDGIIEPWTTLEVTTNDTRLSWNDFTQEVRDTIADGEQAAAEARQQALDALARVAAVEAGLTGRPVFELGEDGTRIIGVRDEQGSIILLDADMVIAPGSITTRQLTVTDLGHNIIPNGAFIYGDLRGWKDVPENWGLIARGSDPAAAVQAAPTGHVLYMDQATSARVATIAEDIPVRGGEMLSWEIASAVISGTADVGLRFNWYAANGVALTPTTSDLPIGTNWGVIRGTVNIPQNAPRVDIEMFRRGGGAGRALATHIKVLNVSDAATIIRPGSIFSPQIAANAITAEKIAALSVTAEKIAAQAVTADKADFNSFAAVEGYVSRLNIQQLAVNEQLIDFNAITETYQAFTEGGVTSVSDDSTDFFLVQSLAVPKAAQHSIMLTLQFEGRNRYAAQVGGATFVSPLEVRLLRDGAALFTRRISRGGGSDGDNWQIYNLNWVDSSSVSGTPIYSLHLRGTSTSGNVGVERPAARFRLIAAQRVKR